MNIVHVRGTSANSEPTFSIPTTERTPVESQEHTIKVEEKNGLTVADLAAFAESCTGSGFVMSECRVKARTDFRGHLLWVSATKS